MTTADSSTQPQRLREALDEEKARNFRKCYYDPNMERWLRMRAESPAEFAAQPPLVHDRTQIYADLREPYTAALAAGIITEDD